MKKTFKIIVSTAVIAPLLLVGSTMAHGGETHEADHGGSSKVETQLEAMRARREAAKATLQQRLEERKTRLQIQLDAARAQHLSQRCKPAQARIISLGERVNGNVPKRYRAYEALTDRLTTLIEKLGTTAVNTAELQSQKTELEAKIAAFKTDLEAYQLALEDTGTLDCTADPAAFQASLEATRGLRQALQQKATEIRTYVIETIKPELVAIRQQLESQTDTEGDD